MILDLTAFRVPKRTAAIPKVPTAGAQGHPRDGRQNLEKGVGVTGNTCLSLRDAPGKEEPRRKATGPLVRSSLSSADHIRLGKGARLQKICLPSPSAPRTRGNDVEIVIGTDQL